MKTLLRVCLVLLGAIALSTSETGEIDKAALKYVVLLIYEISPSRSKEVALVHILVQGYVLPTSC